MDSNAQGARGGRNEARGGRGAGRGAVGGPTSLGPGSSPPFGAQVNSLIKSFELCSIAVLVNSFISFELC